MDQNFTNKIQQFLLLKNPSDDQIIAAALLLLQLAPSRYRGLYNTTLRRPKALLPWIRTDLKKYLSIRQRGLELSQVEPYNTETVHRVEETLSVVPSTVSQSDKEESDDEKPSLVPVLGTKGRREDHDSLPEDIQSLWDKNAERWKQMRKYHAQLSQMIARPGYAPCDGNELCFQLRQLDDALRDDYARYDSYDPATANQPAAQSEKDSLEVYTDNVKTIQNARTGISRGLARKKPYSEETLRKLQEMVDTLAALKQPLKPETVRKLKAVGISVTHC